VAAVLTITSYHRLSPDIQGVQKVDAGPFTIGRGRDCDWVLVDTEKLLSKRHCTIERQGSGYAIVDHSLNGTFLNGDTVAIGQGGRRELHDGDVVRLSDYEIRVTVTPEAEAAQAQEERREEAFAGLSATTAAPPDPDRLGQRAAVRPRDRETDWRAGNSPGMAGEAPESGEMPAWTPGSERVALRPTHAVIPEDWQERVEAPEAPESGADEPAPRFPGPAADEAEAAPERADAPHAPAAPTAAGQEAAPPVAPGAGPAGDQPGVFAPPLPEGPAAGGSGVESGDRPAAPHAPPSPGGAEPSPRGTGTPAPPREPRPTGGTGQASDGLAAFLRGAGLDPAMVPGDDPERTLETAGALFSAAVAGMIDVLGTRSEVRNEFRLTQTVIRPTENNPLKFSASATDALRVLLSRNASGYMSAQAAMNEAVDDVKAHQIAVMAGVQAAVQGLLKRFDPEALERRFAQERGVAVLGSRKARCWDAFVRLYGEIAEEAEDDFHAVLGREFAKAYEACARNRRPG